MTPVYVRNCWYVAAWRHELEAGRLVNCTLLNEPIVLWRREDGGLAALQDRCAHRAVPLSMGRLEGDELRCLYHGFKFDVSGACREIPGKPRVPAGVRVKSYPVAEKDSWVWVWMGAPEAADEALIPDTFALDDPAWALRHGHVDYNAYYQLVNDNLTDLSHLSYVHPQSFGVGEEWGTSEPRIEPLPRGLRISRWLDVTEPRPMMDMPAPPPHQVWQSYDYLVPGILIMRTAQFWPGTMQSCNGGPPGADAQPFFDTCAAQAVTACTDRTTRYFYAVGVRGGLPMSDMAADLGLKMAQMAFEEDRILIEAQQRNIDLTGDQMLLAGQDAAPVRIRALIDTLAAADAA